MTTLRAAPRNTRAQLHAMANSLQRRWRGGTRAERLGYLVGAVLVVSGLTHLLILLTTAATWTGPVSLRKPMSFGLSFGLTLATVVWVTPHIRVGDRVRASLLGIFTLVCVVETSLVTLQAWRGVPSHFNFETPFDTAISQTLAFGGFVIIATVLAWTLAAFRASASTSASMRLAVRFGLITLVGALAVGAAMIATGVSVVRTNPELAYESAGYLKPAHAVAMHAILVVPGIAWLLEFSAWSEALRLRVVGLAVGSYVVLGVVVLLESLAHIAPLAAPLLPTLASAIGAAGLLAAAALAAYAALVHRRTNASTDPR